MGKEQFLTAIIDIKQYLSLTEHLFISVYLYGSVTRLEAIENISDIDLLFLYEKNLDRRHIDFLINLKNKIKIKYGIPLHTRLRLVDDLVTGRSGLMDCGFTSSINKLRDGIILYGLDITPKYYNYITQSSEDDIKVNLKNRWSEICYKNLDIFQHEENTKKQLLYVISAMAELICYSQGMFSLGIDNALNKAFHLTGLTIFKDYWQIKRGGLININIGEAIEKNAEIIDIYSSPGNWNQITQLKKILLIDSNQEDLFANYSASEKKQLMENKIFPKRSEIINNDLIIYYNQGNNR